MGLAKGYESFQTIPWVYMIGYWHPRASVIGLLQNGSNYLVFVPIPKLYRGDVIHNISCHHMT